MVDIGSLGGTLGFVNWMNNRGQVVGSSTVAGDQTDRPYLWDKKKGLQDLGLFSGGVHGNAEGINDAGEVVGGSDSSNGFHAFLWKKGVMSDLGNLAGDCSSQANSINSRGQIVGSGTLDCNNEAHAILFENGGVPIDLNTLVLHGSGLTVMNAFNINDRSEIVGVGILPNGDFRSVLLIPCDEGHPGVEGCDYSLVDAATAAQSAAPRYLPSGTRRPPQSRWNNRYHMLGLQSPGR